MQAVEDEKQGCASRPADGKVSLPATHKSVRRFRKLRKAKPRPLDSRVNIGLAFHRWRSLKEATRLRSDAEMAVYLLDVMDKDSTASDSSGANSQRIKISQSEVQTLIEQEVHKGLADNEAKMRGLVDVLQKMSSDIDFDKSLHKLETQLNTVSRRAEAAFAYIAKIQNQSLPPSPGHKNSSGEVVGEGSMETLPQSSEQQLERECLTTTGKLAKMIETTTTKLKDIRAADAELTAAMGDFYPEEPPPVLTPNGFCVEKNEHLSSDNEGEMKPPPVITFGSTETVCLKAIKREVTDTQEEENHRNLHLPEEPQIKKFKEDCDLLSCGTHSSDNGQKLLVYPALPTTHFPSVLNMEAASYSMPQKVELKLALIRNPNRLSVLWNVMEKDPNAPPMDSYTIFLTMEKVKGSGIFPKWTSYDQLKATSLPMGALIKKYKPGHKVCAAVVGKDIFGRYGPYSEVVTKTMPE